jgi:hypothetical protein
VEAELSGRDWKRIEAELNETYPKTPETNGQATDQVQGPPVRRDEAAVLRHIADALRNSETGSSNHESVAVRDIGPSSSRLRTRNIID